MEKDIYEAFLTKYTGLDTIKYPELDDREDVEDEKIKGVVSYVVFYKKILPEIFSNLMTRVKDQIKKESDYKRIREIVDISVKAFEEVFDLIPSDKTIADEFIILWAYFSKQLGLRQLSVVDWQMFEQVVNFYSLNQLFRTKRNLKSYSKQRYYRLKKSRTFKKSLRMLGHRLIQQMYFFEVLEQHGIKDIRLK